MRRIIALSIVAIAAGSFTTPAIAANDDGTGQASRPTCFMKKIRVYDSYRYLVVKQIRICA